MFFFPLLSPSPSSTNSGEILGNSPVISFLFLSVPRLRRKQFQLFQVDSERRQNNFPILSDFSPRHANCCGRFCLSSRTNVGKKAFVFRLPRTYLPDRISEGDEESLKHTFIPQFQTPSHAAQSTENHKYLPNETYV